MTRSDPHSLYALLLSAELPLDADILWVADENMPPEALHQLSRFEQLTFLTNRADVYASAKNVLTLPAAVVCFSDFDFTDFNLASKKFDAIVYRISKERAVCHWVLNNTLPLLKPEGRLVLAGDKNDGIKSYVDKASTVLGFAGRAQKKGNGYIANLKVNTARPIAECERLDDKNYPLSRNIGTLYGQTFSSKPGIYGWDKFDAGSRILVDTFYDWIKTLEDENTLKELTALDLGCGYGLLSLALHNAGIGGIIATDNNAAAVAMCDLNLTNNHATNFTVTAADCGKGINTHADIVLCNPPFHQGFSIDSSLTARFIQAAANTLRRQGVAFFVVNAFIPIEKVAQNHFKFCTTLFNNKQFKVLMLKHSA
ncbi:methyltransferase [Teredinibacter purpureus]|uniref:methyltransferase n=1 Tax=Teredinibacter purpureus TaxID=2731756 RepID=UPI0006972715|nr:methyltransferase [Teredinibacter purpureus]